MLLYLCIYLFIICLFLCFFVSLFLFSLCLYLLIGALVLVDDDDCGVVSIDDDDIVDALCVFFTCYLVIFV